jgi:hypothetical protein
MSTCVAPFLQNSRRDDAGARLLQIPAIRGEFLLVGERGFEPPTPWSRSRRFTTLTDWSGSTYKSVGVQPVAPSLHPFVTHPEWGKKQNGTREAHPLNLKRELFEE